MDNKYHKQGLKKLILKEALSVVRIQGYESLSVRSITSSIGTSPTALYRHYSSLEDLIHYIILELSQEITNFLMSKEIEGATPVDNLKYISYGFVEYSLLEKNSFELLFLSPYVIKGVNLAETRYLPLVEYIKSIIIKIANKVRPTVNTETLFIQLWSFILGYAIILKEQEDKYDKTIIDNMITLFFNLKKGE